MENWCYDKPTLYTPKPSTPLQKPALVLSRRGVDWDAVELPSQFMENWCYDKPTLYSFAKHYQTGEPLPADMFERLKAAKTFRAATQMLRQVRVEGFGCGLSRLQGFRVGGKPLPADMFERPKAAKTFRAATQMLRQVRVQSVV
jgi:Zn-dependent oligopeptidase